MSSLANKSELGDDRQKLAEQDTTAPAPSIPGKQRADFALLGQRLAGLRDACGYNQERFAELLGISGKRLAAYEQTGYDIPISLLMHAAHLCHVDMAVLLTGTSTHLQSYQVVRAGQGRKVDRFPGYRFADLAYNYTGKIMQPLLVTLDPGDEPAELVSHAGQ